MTITRNGTSIELTPEEVLAAYFEQQHIFDVSDVGLFADMCDDNYADQTYVDLIRDPDVAEEVALKYREYLDNDDSGAWFDTMSYAVMNVGDSLTKQGEA